MGKIVYRLRQFNASDANEGALAVVVSKNYNSSSISNISYDGSSWSKTSGFVGAGILKPIDSRFYITIDDVRYMFNYSGEGLNDSLSYKVMLGTIEEAEASSIVSTGNVTNSTTTSVTTRNVDEETGDIEDTVEVTDLPDSVFIENMTPRDIFANQALRGIISHINNPTGLSPSAINNYCELAYKWAAQMMKAAANARTNFVDNSVDDEEIKEIKVGFLENNNDKLLNNLIYELNKTNFKEEIDRDEDDKPIYEYSERIHNPKLLSELEKTDYREQIDTDEDDNPIYEYSKRIYDPKLEAAIKDLDNHVTTQLAAIAAGQGGGGGSTDKEDKLSIVPVSSGTSSITAEVNKYYNISGNVGTLTITLPIPTDVTHVSNIIFFLTTGSTPAVTITSTANILYQDGYSIDAETSYEINCLFNGSQWIIASTIINV